MRKLVLLIPFLLLVTACQTTWKGQGGSDLTAEQRAAGVKSVDALADEYETTTYWASVRRTWDGRRNAFGRGLGNISDTFGRHFLNYSKTDPYVNYPSDVGYLQHTGRFATSWIGGLLPR